jgi:hypothetical protein
MSADLTRHYIPVEVEEIKEMAPTEANRITRLEMQFNEFREKFSTFMGALRGDDGQGGLLPEIKQSLEELKVGQRQMEDQMSTMASTQIRDRADLEALINGNKNDINAVGEIARTNRENLKGHCEDMEDRRKFRIEMAAPYIALVVALAGVLVAVFV